MDSPSGDRAKLPQVALSEFRAFLNGLPAPHAILLLAMCGKALKLLPDGGARTGCQSHPDNGQSKE